MSDRKLALLRAEDERFGEIHRLVERLTPQQLEEPGYSEEWSARDLIAHLACWCAEAARSLEQIRLGTYRGESEEDVDVVNARFHDACRGLSLDDVKAELAAGRYRMLQEWGDVVDLTPEAVTWFRESGPEHYDDHLPRLRRWVAELTGTPVGSS